MPELTRRPLSMDCPSARLPPVSDAIKSQVLAGKTMSDADMDKVTAGGQPGTLGAGLTTAWYASDWKAAGSPHLMRARALFSPATAETRARTTLRETKPRAVLSAGPFASPPVNVIPARTAPRGKARNCR